MKNTQKRKTRAEVVAEELHGVVNGIYEHVNDCRDALNALQKVGRQDLIACLNSEIEACKKVASLIMLRVEAIKKGATA